MTSATTPAARPGPLAARNRGVEIVGSSRAEEHVGALLHEPEGDAAADAAARAGDERHLAAEAQIHPR